MTEGNFFRVLRDAAREVGTKTAFTYLSPGEEPRHATYEELDASAVRIAAWLFREGVRPGDRVLLAAAEGLDFIRAFFGCVYAGAIPITAPAPRPPFQRLASMLRDGSAKAIVLSASSMHFVDELARHADPTVLKGAQDPLTVLAIEQAFEGPVLPFREPSLHTDDALFIQYTSGSLALPKGVVVTHANALANCAEIAQPAGTKIVNWLPLFHDFGLVCGVLVPIFARVPCVMMSQWTFLQRPIRWLQAIADHGATHSAAPNFAFDLCVRAIPEEKRTALDLRSWQAAIIASEPIRAETLRRFVAAFAPSGVHENIFVPAYGLAESTLQVTRHRELEPLVVTRVDREELGRGRIVGSRGEGSALELVGCGASKPGTRVVVVDPIERVPRGSNEIGEIWIAGPCVAHGYFGRPEETRQVFGATLASGEGPYLRTGDLGFLRDDQLFVTGRLKELLILNGANHYPTDIELTVERSHPAIRRDGAAAFGIEDGPSERLAVVAEVEIASREEAEEAAAALRKSVAFEHDLAIGRLALVRPHAIPRTSSGKLRRGACRDLLLSGELPILYSDGVGEASVASA
jgi:acyl-CoA synthetase (AMP-forming)/AMP-acid ligase II